MFIYTQSTMSEDNITHTEEINPLNGEILSSDHINISVPEDAAADEYMARFDAVENQNLAVKELVRSLPNLPGQNARNLTIIQILAEQQKLNEQMFDLLVEMNNFFSPK